jgi:hypothetical protein
MESTQARNSLVRSWIGMLSVESSVSLVSCNVESRDTYQSYAEAKNRMSSSKSAMLLPDDLGVACFSFGPPPSPFKPLQIV